MGSAIDFEPGAFLSPTVSDDSDSSDEESAISSVKIKTEMSDYDTDIKENVRSDDVCDTEENDEHKIQVNIKQEIVDEIHCLELNDTKLESNNEQGVVVKMNNDELEKTVDMNNGTEEANEDENDKDNQTELNIDIKVNDEDKQQGKILDEESSTINPIVRRRRGKFKDIVTENEQTSKIECRKPIKIKQEPVEYEMELDAPEDTIDGDKRELRPRNLSDPQVFFEPYDGTSEDSDFTDLSD